MASKLSTPSYVSDPVYDLVHSMSRMEKRYFKINTQSIRNNRGEIPDYYALFEILDKMKTFDKVKAEQKLLQKLGKKSFSNFTVKKNELYDVLMKSLRSYSFKQTKKSADYIKVLMRDTNFLFKRGLFKDAERHLKEARKLAEKCGDTISLIEINRFERDYISTTRSRNRDKKLEAIHAEKNLLIEKLIEEEHIRVGYDLLGSKRLKVNMLTNDDEIRDLKLKFSYLLKLDRTQTLSKISKRYLDVALAEYYYLLRENKLYVESRLASLDWWEENEIWRNQSPHYYIVALSNLLAGYRNLGLYDEYLFILKKIEKIKPNNQYEAAMRFHRLMINRQIYFLNKGLIDEVCNLSHTIEKGIKNHKLNEGVQIVLIYNVVVAFFIKKRYQECIKWVGLYEPFKKMQITKLDIQFAQILRLIAFFELEDLDQLEKHAKLTEKYYNNQLELPRQSLDNILLRTIKRIGKVIPKEQSKIIKELYVTLNDLPPRIKKRLGFDEANLWVKSKIERKTIIQLLEERNRKKGKS